MAHGTLNKVCHTAVLSSSDPRMVFWKRYPILWYKTVQGSGVFYPETEFITTYSLFSRLQSFRKMNIFSNLRGLSARRVALGCYIDFSGHPKQSFPLY